MHSCVRRFVAYAYTYVPVLSSTRVRIAILKYVHVYPIAEKGYSHGVLLDSVVPSCTPIGNAPFVSFLHELRGVFCFISGPSCSVSLAQAGLMHIFPATATTKNTKYIV